MAGFGQSKIEEVRARADIVEIIGAHVRLKRAGRNFVGLCPFHNEKTPSFSVNAERGFFHCFGCGVGGTVFDFVMRIETLSFAEALQSLARRYNIVLPEHRGESSAGVPGERDALIRANQLAAEFFQHVLWNTSDGSLARDYLKHRGITIETAKAFLLGFAPARPANLAAVMRKRGLADAALKLGLIRRDPAGELYDMFRARLMFPIRDAQARVIAFGGRVLDQRLPKYINSTESAIYSKARAVYGVYEARQAITRSDRAIVVEGYIDAIALWQAGFKETVASLGTALTVEQLRLLSRYTRNIVACFDGDPAGRKASLRALETFLAAGLLGRGAFLPSGHDPDTMVRDRGAQAFAELVEAAEPLVDYYIQEEQRALGGPEAPIEKRAEAARRVAEKLRLVSDNIQFQLLVRKAVAVLGFRQREEQILRTLGRQGAPRAEVARIPHPINDDVELAGIGILAIALGYPAMRAEILAHWQADSSELDRLIDQVCRSNESQAELEVTVMAALDDGKRTRLSALMVETVPTDPPQQRQLLADYCSAIARGRRRREVANLLRAATTAGTDGADAAANAQKLIDIRRNAHRH